MMKNVEHERKKIAVETVRTLRLGNNGLRPGLSFLILKRLNVDVILNFPKITDRSVHKWLFVDVIRGLVVRVSGCRSRGPGFYSRPYRIF
jgi:hypothetical protein